MTIFDSLRYPVTELMPEGYWMNTVEYMAIPIEIRIKFNETVTEVIGFRTHYGLEHRNYLRKLILEWEDPIEISQPDLEK